MRLPIKVVPGSSREGVAGWLGDALKVRVRAPAEGGRANRAAEEVVAGAVGVPVADVRIVGGAASPRKVVAIARLSEDEVRRRLGKARP